MRAEELRAQAAQAREDAAALEAQAGAWEAGAAGERIVADELAALPSGFHVLHDRLLNPGKSQANLDHLVISEAGVFFIDAKLWAGNITAYEGGLWQHTHAPGGQSTSKPKNAELDKIAGMSASMAKHLNGPVTPVLALANKRTRGFDTVTLRGVHVMPAGALTSWLTAQPAIVAKPDVEGLRLKVDLAFPPAGDGIRDDYQYTTLPGMLSGTSGLTEARPPVNAFVHHYPLRRILAAGLIGLLLIVGYKNAKPLLTDFGIITPAYTLLDGTPAPTRACDAITAADIQQVTGRTAYPDPTTTGTVCNWYLTPPQGVAVADITITTGRPVHYSTSRLSAPQASAVSGTALYEAPQHRHVPGAKATPDQVTQPFTITYRYTGTTTTAAAQAKRVVTRLATLFADRLPQGDGADRIPQF